MPRAGPLQRVDHDGLGRVILMALATVYIISPLDFIPDFLPVLGQLKCVRSRRR
jgi:uncharacterized membrane protein YkvA (DUF1232 family)